MEQDGQLELREEWQQQPWPLTGPLSLFVPTDRLNLTLWVGKRGTCTAHCSWNFLPLLSCA